MDYYTIVYHKNLHIISEDESSFNCVSVSLLRVCVYVCDTIDASSTFTSHGLNGMRAIFHHPFSVYETKWVPFFNKKTMAIQASNDSLVGNLKLHIIAERTIFVLHVDEKENPPFYWSWQFKANAWTTCRSRLLHFYSCGIEFVCNDGEIWCLQFSKLIPSASSLSSCCTMLVVIIL